MVCKICNKNTFDLIDGTCWASAEAFLEDNNNKIHQFVPLNDDK